DRSLAIGRGLHSASAQSGDVAVRATGPASVDVDASARAGAADLQTLAGMYGPYPWSELDIVAVSLGPDAGGMEWPGAGWIAGLEDGVGGVGGRDRTVAGLRDVVARHAFGIITPAEMRDEIAAALPGQADTVRALWDGYIGPPGCGA